MYGTNLARLYGGTVDQCFGSDRDPDAIWSGDPDPNPDRGRQKMPPPPQKGKKEENHA